MRKTRSLGAQRTAENAAAGRREDEAWDLRQAQLTLNRDKRKYEQRCKTRRRIKWIKERYKAFKEGKVRGYMDFSGR